MHSILWKKYAIFSFCFLFNEAVNIKEYSVELFGKDGQKPYE
jgi:hypothetical protein